MLTNLAVMTVAAIVAWVAYATWRGVGGVIAAVVLGGLALLLTYDAKPTLAVDFAHVPLILLLFSIVMLGLLAVGALARGLSMESHEGGDGLRVLRPLGLMMVAAVWLGAQVVTSLGIFHAEAYRGIIDVTEQKMDRTVALIDQSHARLIDERLALRRAQELLGTDKGLGSTFRVGEPTAQVVKGEQVWVAPLEPAGFWVWWSGKVSPGYIVVSATDYSNARIVLDRPLRTSNGLWFGENVERIAYRAAPTRGQSEPDFEIDDEGHPYFVVSLYSHTIGADGAKVDGVMLIDASTAEVRFHTPDDVPAWVDRIQPAWVSYSQLDSWGDFVGGWWNPSKEDIVQPTNGMTLVTLANGRSAWFTGIVNARSQSSNSEAINGFALVDARTGKANVYYEQGISEAAAGKVIEGAVQDTRYTAVTPVAYNVHGALTYVTTLKDAAGNPRLVGMVSALDRSVVATGPNLEDVTRLYGTRLRGSSQRTTKLESETQVQAVTGTLLRSGGYTSNGQAFQLVRLDVDGAQRDFTVDLSAPGLRNIVLARSGDKVHLSVYTSKDGAVEVREVAVDTPTP